ncbi:thiolase family protein [Bacillus tianshenii]|nr:thiolase family protein [Bacillus tianshenii]
MTKTAVLTGGIRTPFGKFGGFFKDFSTVELSSIVMKELLKRSEGLSDKISNVNWGVCTQAEAEEVVAPVIARQALLKAGLPPETNSMTIDKACCSGMSAVSQSAHTIMRGDAAISIAGGAEVMSRTPMMIRPLRWGNRLGDVNIRDPLNGIRYMDYNLVSIDAADVALEYGVSREEQDKWAYRSQQRWKQANEGGKFSDEVMEITKTDRKNNVYTCKEDEFPRPETTYEKLASLKTVLGSSTVTPGNAPGLNDGAVGLMLMDAETAKQNNQPILAEIISTASVATNPRDIATVPALAIQKALEKADLTVDDLSLFEINEAFAAVPLVSTILLGEKNKEKIEEIRSKTNVNGGSIAMGHPVGASGARILLTLIHELRRNGGGYGAASICGGLAQGEAIIIKVPSE